MSPTHGGRAPLLLAGQSRQAQRGAELRPALPWGRAELSWPVLRAGGQVRAGRRSRMWSRASSQVPARSLSPGLSRQAPPARPTPSAAGSAQRPALPLARQASAGTSLHADSPPRVVCGGATWRPPGRRVGRGGEQAALSRGLGHKSRGLTWDPANSSAPGELAKCKTGHCRFFRTRRGFDTCTRQSPLEFTVLADTARGPIKRAHSRGARQTGRRRRVPRWDLRRLKGFRPRALLNTDLKRNGVARPQGVMAETVACKPVLDRPVGERGAVGRGRARPPSPALLPRG